MSGPLLHHHALIKGVSAVGFVPLDADVLNLLTKNNPTDYTKTGGAVWRGWGYRDIAFAINSEIYNTNTTNHAHISGFYDKTNGIPEAFKNFPYGIMYVTNTNRAYEYGVLKYSEVGIFSDTKRVKKISGSAEWYVNDVKIYTSLTDYTVGQFGICVGVTGQSAQNVNFKA